MTLKNASMIRVRGLGKTFILHQQGGVRLPVLADVSFDVAAGECLVLAGPSGAGKSTLLRTLYGNYRLQSGSVAIRHDGHFVDLGSASAQAVLDLRRRTVGYVSQFLRVIPRVPALDVVAEPLLARGVNPAQARAEAGEWLARMNLPERLWHLPPATFSGGEQQRVNIARSLIVSYPVLLLDEPTASLDAANRRLVVDLMVRARENGAALVGIFHDAEVREAVGTRNYSVEPMREAA
ncbi:MAG TPA: phosphonate C-P lyase system protein PhnL [Rhodocyclaceae bacterium]